MKNIAIYGGSFDPIHIGHINVGKYIIENGYADSLLFMVAPSSPFKDYDQVSPFHRYKMCKRAVEEAHDQRLMVSDYQIKNFGFAKNCYSVDLFKSLIWENMDAYNEEYRYSFVIGADVALSFRMFHDYHWFENNKLVDFIIVPRPSYSLNDDLLAELFKGLNYVYLKDCPQMEISSTQLREEIKRNGTPSALSVGSSVAEYIKQNKLYL